MRNDNLNQQIQANSPCVTTIPVWVTTISNHVLFRTVYMKLHVGTQQVIFVSLACYY